MLILLSFFRDNRAIALCTGCDIHQTRHAVDLFALLMSTRLSRNGKADNALKILNFVVLYHVYIINFNYKMLKKGNTVVNQLRMYWYRTTVTRDYGFK